VADSALFESGNIIKIESPREASLTFDSERLHRDFGAILRLMTATDRRLLRLGSIEAQLMPALRLRQYEVLYDSRRVPTGYASWAFVADDVLAELRTDPDRLLRIAEWNEGVNLWLVDFVALGNRARTLAARLKARFAATHGEVHAVRGGRPIRLRLSR
jgi:hemolysin-activating ACP:hemolysin acyltransferase